MQMFVTQKSESRKRKLQMMEDDEIDTAKAIGLCAVRAKRPRKERSPDEQRSSSWWRHGYQNWDDSAFKKRLRIEQTKPNQNWDDSAFKKRSRIEQTFVKSSNVSVYSGEIEAQLIKEPSRFKPVQITPDTQLAICLSSSAHECTYNTVGDLFGVAESTVSVIFNQVCKILVSTLYDRFVYLPRNSAEWKQELESFLENWEFPCVGAWDGFHVYVSTKLKNYFSFKKRYSVSSLGFIVSNKRFLWAAVGAPGSTHDSRFLKSCDLYADIRQGRIFPSSVLRTREYGDIPFTTVGDSAFPRNTWLMKSYSESTRDPRKRYLNKRLCSGRVVSEHAYDMLNGRSSILCKKTECKLKNIRQVIMASIALHNIRIARDDP
ncbi:protein ALP1-like [Stylophora pistillata]|uniref:protein ALP1-like n=1 Tax=Stylophora pistillata TaxID=50429 RepID=UPI000C03DEC5|nr:protein ALP1-like [Stylophora pistillata]